MTKNRWYTDVISNWDPMDNKLSKWEYYRIIDRNSGRSNIQQNIQDISKLIHHTVFSYSSLIENFLYFFFVYLAANQSCKIILSAFIFSQKIVYWIEYNILSHCGAHKHWTNKTFRYNETYWILNPASIPRKKTVNIYVLLTHHLQRYKIRNRKTVK